VTVLVVDLWTDGSGTSQGNPGGWAYVLRTVHADTGEVFEKEGSGYSWDTTNNRMEMTALLEGLRALKRTSVVVVHTDSEYVMRPFVHGWLAKWEGRNWLKVKNVDLWQLLKAEVEKHMVSFEWVKGHSGVNLNERCDKLAGAKRRWALERKREADEAVAANPAPTLLDVVVD
jgi:ribonuclease HI